MSRHFFLFAFFLLQTNVFASQLDTLSLDEVVLKSTLINQSNPALSVSAISYKENEIRPVNFQNAIDFSAGLWITNSENQAQDNSCLLYTSPSPRDNKASRMPSSA